MLFRRHAVEFEAKQFTGDNFEELREFTGVGQTDEIDIDTNQRPDRPLFNPINTHLQEHLHNKNGVSPKAELWEISANQWIPVYVGEWIVPDDGGFMSVNHDWMMINCVMLDDETLALLRAEEEPKTFEQELLKLLNKHSKESYSGTPDWILTEFLRKCLEAWDLGVRMRADWRGESTELPALNELRGGREKEVPLVIYTNAQRNEVGVAKISVTPGEVLASGTITGAIPIFGAENISAAYSLELETPEAEPLDAIAGSKATQDAGRHIATGVVEGLSSFDRYQKKGLSDNG